MGKRIGLGQLFSLPVISYVKERTKASDRNVVCDSVSDMAVLHLHLTFALTVISLVSTPTSCKLVESLVSTRENFRLKGYVM